MTIDEMSKQLLKVSGNNYELCAFEKSKRTSNVCAIIWDVKEEKSFAIEIDSNVKIDSNIGNYLYNKIINN